MKLLTIRRVLDVCPFNYISLNRKEGSPNGELGVWAVRAFLGYGQSNPHLTLKQTPGNIPSKAPFISFSLSSIDMAQACTGDIICKLNWECGRKSLRDKIQ
jgi:hypothetical protein